MKYAVKDLFEQLVLGRAALPQQCTLGLPDPQEEVRVWLEGMGSALDVTSNHVVACASPLLVGIGLDDGRRRQASSSTVSLKIRERCGKVRLLADVALQFCDEVQASGQELSLFRVRSCRNHCLSLPRLWAYDLYKSFRRWRRDKNPEIRMSILGARSMSALFICPRPVVLVTAMHEGVGNIFPMNLFGQIAGGYFAFALNSLRTAAPLVERAGRVALSSIPLEFADVVRPLGKNHRLEFANWDKLPFPLARSNTFGFPIPEFALRIRELEIDAVRRLGSHTLFFGRVVHDERLRDEPQFCMIHGIYQAWRLAQGSQAAPIAIHAGQA
jgi:flavin reductase (DIM6/NTAB) family NADH-FMN oxidoreductase RutF